MLLILIFINAISSPFFLTVSNQINLFQLSIEKVIVALIMTLVIINGEIDLSVASIMGLAACAFGFLFQAGVPTSGSIVLALLLGGICGAFNGFWIAWVGIPSLVVTLATLIGFRGFARVLLRIAVSQTSGMVRPVGSGRHTRAFSFIDADIFCLIIICYVVLQRSTFGRKLYFIGSNRDVAEYSGVDVRRIKGTVFVASGFIAALAGVLFAARVGAVRGDVALGFELDIITIVLLGGVSIFGGSGSLTGTVLSILIVLNLRNGMSLANFTGHLQTGALGILLILSVMVPNIRATAARMWKAIRVQPT